MDALTGCDFPWAPRFVPGCFVSYRVLSKRVGEKFDVRPFGLTIWLEPVVDHAPQRGQLATG